MATMDERYPNIAILYRSQWSPEDAVKVTELITESIHQGFDGWSSREKSVIRKYLNDLGIAYKAL